jgi:proliferating cell nuclear antigen
MMHTPQSEITQDSQFSILSSSSAIWRMISSSVQTLSEDCTFELDADGVRTRAMDPSHVALLDVKFPGTAFDNFQCAKPAKFTVHLEDFAKIVKRSDLKDSFELSRSEGKSLAIKIGSGNYRREFELHLLDDETKTSPLPKLTFTTRFATSLGALSQILNDISIVSPHISVCVSSESVILSGKGDNGKVRISLGKEDGALLQEVSADSVSEETRAVYNLEYLLKIVKSVSSFCDYVRFEYSSKMPLRLEFMSMEKRSSGPVQFYLAPKLID